MRKEAQNGIKGAILVNSVRHVDTSGEGSSSTWFMIWKRKGSV